MLGVLIAALATPQPSPPPLKTISHVRSTPFCTALRENIGHAVGALAANKTVIGNGKSILLRMAHDQVSRTSPGLVIDMDMVKIDRVVGAMVKNVELTDRALSDLKRIPASPKTEEERRLAQMRDQLRAVEERQKFALNVFSGMYESYSSNELQGKADAMAGATGPDNVKPPDLSAQGGPDMGAPVVLPPLKSDGAPSPPPDPAPNVTPTPIPVHDMGLAGDTSFAGLFNGITTDQVYEEALESQAAKTILQYTDECK